MQLNAMKHLQMKFVDTLMVMMFSKDSLLKENVYWI